MPSTNVDGEGKFNCQMGARSGNGANPHSPHCAKRQDLGLKTVAYHGREVTSLCYLTMSLRSYAEDNEEIERI